MIDFGLIIQQLFLINSIGFGQQNDIIIITQIIQKMQRGRSQQSRTLQSKLKNIIEKSRPNQSKGKNFIDSNQLSTAQSHNKNVSATTSPHLIKQADSDKQNLDLFDTVMKIVSAAAEAKEKQILLSLASHVQRQKKIRTYLSQKQSNSEKVQLQAMLAHLKQEEAKEISSLKIEIGKRKLQNLDKHDLSEDILNLNSYVMRRTKKESAILKTQGADLIGEIYNKFDEQARIIAQVIGNDKGPCRQNPVQQKNLAHQFNLKEFHDQVHINCKTVQSCLKEEKDRVSTSKISQISESSSSSELMHKILRLQKQNLRLMKEIGKIQQQFQCVVQEKLLLQEKNQRVKASYRHLKNKINKCFNQLRAQLNQQKDVQEINKKEVVDLLKEQKKYFYQQFSLLETTFSLQSDNREEIQSPYSQKSGSSPDQLKNSIQSQCSVLERYEALLTQKQIQINTVLKSISKIKQEYQEAQRTLDIQRQIIQKQEQFKEKTRLEINNLKICIKNAQSLIFQTGKLVQNSIHQFGRQKDKIAAQVNRQIMDLESEMKYFRQENQKKQQQLLKKEEIVMRSNDRANRLQKQSKAWQQKYEEQVSQNEKDKKRLAAQITKIENILKSEQIKAQESIDQMKNSIVQLSQENHKKMTDQQLYIQQIQAEKDLLIQQNRQMRTQIESLRSQVRKLREETEKYAKLQETWSTNEGRLVESLQNLRRETKDYMKFEDYQQKLKQMESQFQNRRNSMIQQCGMLLEGKNEEINGYKLLIERQRIVKQDLFSVFREKHSNCLSQRSKKKLKKMLGQIVLQLNQFKSKSKQIFTFSQSLNREFQSWLSSFSTQIKSKLQNKISRGHIMSYQNQVMTICNIPSNESLTWQNQVDQIWVLLGNKFQQKEFEKNTMEQKLKALKKAINELIQERNDKRKRLSLLQIEQKENVKLDEKQYEKNQINDYEALSPEELQQTKSEKSSFLSELEPFRFENILGEEQTNFTEIIDESMIVEEVCALRNQLGESFKKIQSLKKELKMYQQKDIDKIFDF